MRPVLVLRPQPGADATAARAVARGLEAIVAPLFRIAPRSWALPEGHFDALLVTSANTARMLDEQVDRGLPAYAVGQATADALEASGFTNVVTGSGGVDQVVGMAATAGVGRLLHLAGEDRTSFDLRGLRIETRIVYAAEPEAPGPAFAAAMARDAVALLHSARAARRFRELAGTNGRIAAISLAVLEAAGAGWTATTVADRPSDDALLAAAAPLCH